MGNVPLLSGKARLSLPILRRCTTNFFKNIPDTFTKVENFFEDGEWAILEWSGGGTFMGTGTPKPFKLRGCGFFHVIDGKIKIQRGYWDKHT
ncbi:MAG: nuclear transport factor 2 family protein [Bdellovibrionales bacterium]|nr:nuclear transport factor 2 family protein [Bdellovibrionales bacterium]